VGHGQDQAAPPTVSNRGAAASGTISDIEWNSWAGAVAVGQGLNRIFEPKGGYYPKPEQILAGAALRTKCRQNAQRRCCVYRHVRLFGDGRAAKRFVPRRRLARSLLTAALTLALWPQLPARAEVTAPDPTPTGPLTALKVAGDLAVGPDGKLYVAAPFQHQVLVLLSNGRFRVVAGDGKAGEPVAGRTAVEAELSGPYDLTFGPSGSLYFVDGGRVWTVSTAGVVRLVAGDGASEPRGAYPAHIADGTPALSVSLGSQPWVATAPDGQLYVDTPTQLLHLSSRGTLFSVPTLRASFKSLPLPPSLDLNLTSLAVDSQGDLDVAGFNGWALWRVAPDGTATYVGYDRGSGGSIPHLARGPGGFVYAANGSDLLRVVGTKFVQAYDFNVTVDGEYFWLKSFAFGPGNVVYADSFPGECGFEARQQLIAVKGGHVQLLWQEPAHSACEL